MDKVERSSFLSVWINEEAYADNVKKMDLTKWPPIMRAAWVENKCLGMGNAPRHILYE
jgi:hypothetical protein